MIKMPAYLIERMKKEVEMLVEMGCGCGEDTKGILYEKEHEESEPVSKVISKIITLCHLLSSHPHLTNTW